MCGPIEVAYAAFNFLKADADYKSAKATADYTNQTTASTATAMRNEAIYSDTGLINKRENDVQALALKKLQVQTAAKQKEATAKVGFGEKGIGGNSVDLLLGEIDRQEANIYNTIDLNYISTIQNNDSLRNAENRKISNQILALPRAYKPNAMSYYGSAALSSAAFAYSASGPDSKVSQMNTKINNFFNPGNINLS